MGINKSLIKPILEQLEKVHPKHIEYDRDILPEHKDRKEIMKCLDYCEGEGWITYEEIKAKGTYGQWFIKITNQGIKYLESLS